MEIFLIRSVVVGLASLSLFTAQSAVAASPFGNARMSPDLVSVLSDAQTSANLGWLQNVTNLYVKAPILGNQSSDSPCPALRGAICAAGGPLHSLPGAAKGER